MKRLENYLSTAVTQMLRDTQRPLDPETVRITEDAIAAKIKEQAN